MTQAHDPGPDAIKHVLDLLDGLAPTRPHPRMSPDPVVQRLAGRIAGATDRIRDALTGRTGI